MATEILTSGNTAVNANEQWESKVHREYVEKLMMKQFMGSGSGAFIQVKEELMKSAGDAITINYASEQTGGIVRGRNKGIGNEGDMTFYNQRMVIDNTRALHKVWDVPMSEKRVGYSVKDEARFALTTKMARQFDDDILDGMTDTSVGRVQGRYLYGALDSNYDATEATALATIDATDDVLTSAMIGIAKRKATIKGTGVGVLINPAMVKSGKNMEEWFAFWGHTYAIRDLVNSDAAFRNAQLLLPPGSNSDSILYSGRHFKGSWDGVLIYEYEKMPLGTNTNSIQYAHNLLLGAQAGAVVWGQRTKYSEEPEDLGHNMSTELHDIRNKIGTGANNNVKLVRNSVDHGIVNVFSAAVAD